MGYLRRFFLNRGCERGLQAMSEQAENAFVLSVMSDDHPGIVAAVTSAIQALDGNITACSQTVLKGFFTIIMVASFPAGVTAASLEDAVTASANGRGNFRAEVLPHTPAVPKADRPPCERFVVTAFGGDKQGVIHRFTQYLADKDINIIDLYGDKTGADFVLITQVEVPTHWSVRMIQADLEEMGKEEGFTVRFQHENVFVATNQLRLTQSPG